MTELPDQEPPVRLRPAIVLSTTEDACTVFAGGRTEDVAYARPFPTPPDAVSTEAARSPRFGAGDNVLTGTPTCGGLSLTIEREPTP